MKPIKQRHRSLPNGTASATPAIYAKHKEFGDMGAYGVKRLKQLDQENNCLKKMLRKRGLRLNRERRFRANNGNRTATHGSG